MNKKTIITILLALAAVVGQAKTFTWRIEGTVANAAPTDTLTVIDAEKQRMITSGSESPLTQKAKLILKKDQE